MSRKEIIPICIVVLVGLLAVVRLGLTEKKSMADRHDAHHGHSHSADSHGHDHSDNRGPNGGKMLSDGEFELELVMIRMNLDHLMKRYASELQDATAGGVNVALELDQHERLAIQSARKLYERARTLQTSK